MPRAAWQGRAWGAARGQVPGVEGSGQAGHALVTLHGLVGAFLEPLCSLGRGSRGRCQGLPWAGTAWGTAGGGHVGVLLRGRGAMADSLWLQHRPRHCCLQLLQPLVHLRGKTGAQDKWPGWGSPLPLGRPGLATMTGHIPHRRRSNTEPAPGHL